MNPIIKRFVSLLLAVSLTAVFAAAYEDVPADSWYAEATELCQTEGILTGTVPGHFSPDQIVSVEEGIVMAARLHARLHQTDIPAGSDWFSPSLTYAAAAELVLDGEYASGTVLSREYFVTLLSRIYDFETLPIKNSMTVVCDYGSQTELGGDILRLYQAGILTGIDSYGRFAAQKPMTRAELAVIVARVLEPTLRQSFTPVHIAPYDTWEVPIDLAGLAAAFNSDGIPYIDSLQGAYIRIYTQNGSDSLPVQVYTIYGDYFGEFRGAYGDGDLLQESYSDWWSDSQNVTYYTLDGEKVNETPYYFCHRFYGEEFTVASLEADSGFVIIDRTGEVRYELPAQFDEATILGGMSVDGDYLRPAVEYPYAPFYNYKTGKTVTSPFWMTGYFYNGYAAARQLYHLSTGRAVTATEYDRDRNLFSGNDDWSVREGVYLNLNFKEVPAEEALAAMVPESMRQFTIDENNALVGKDGAYYTPPCEAIWLTEDGNAALYLLDGRLHYIQAAGLFPTA